MLNSALSWVQNGWTFHHQRGRVFQTFWLATYDVAIPRATICVCAHICGANSIVGNLLLRVIGKTHNQCVTSVLKAGMLLGACWKCNADQELDGRKLSIIWNIWMPPLEQMASG